MTRIYTIRFVGTLQVEADNAEEAFDKADAQILAQSVQDWQIIEESDDL